jgi:hypothetical protein
MRSILGRVAAATLLVPWLVLSASVGAADAAQAASATTFSGRATVVNATVLGINTTLGDTGPLPSSGGAEQASLLDANVPGLLTAEVLHASTVGQGNRSAAEASVADVTLTVAGNTIGAELLMARAQASCGPGGASVSGSSEIVGLVVNGQSVAVSGAPNQTISLPLGGTIIINEQDTSTSGSITVNALHVNVPGLADVIISSAHADITCPTGTGAGCTAKDFVTGGGFITTPSGAKGNFGVAGGIKNGAFWGHLTYLDHGTGLKAKGTGVTAYAITGPTSRHIEGNAEVNGQSGFTYTVDVNDQGEPGRSDTFAITLSNGYSAGGTLAGGNIQLHQPCQ